MKFSLAYLLFFSVFSFTLPAEESSNPSYWWPWSYREESHSETSCYGCFNLKHVSDLEEILSRRVIDQPHATQIVANAMISYVAKIHDPNKPIGSFLFVGTTGVGKTELAKALAGEIAPLPAQFIRFNMTEFATVQTGLDRLIGMPWGYINNEQGGALSNALLKHPYSIVLLDEFEKASQDVRLLFLHIFDEGYFITPKGQYVDCRNCIFIATTNLAADVIQEGWRQSLNLDQMLDLVEPKLIENLTPELYGRMEPILFQGLSRGGLMQIIYKNLQEITRKIYEQRQIHLQFDPSVANYILDRCMNLSKGARPVLNIIKKDVVSVIGRALVNKQYKKNDQVSVFYDGNQIVVSSF